MSSALERRIEKLERARGIGREGFHARIFIDGVTADGETREDWERGVPEAVRRRALVVDIVTAPLARGDLCDAEEI